MAHVLQGFGSMRTPHKQQLIKTPEIVVTLLVLILLIASVSIAKTGAGAGAVAVNIIFVSLVMLAVESRYCRSTRIKIPKSY
jgi:ABC-type phosphate transport system permease subunit